MNFLLNHMHIGVNHVKYSILILLLFAQIYVAGQKNITRNITIHGKDTVVEASITVKRDIDMKTIDHVEYYWYAFDKIKMNNGSFSGHLLHGDYKKYVGDYILIQEGRFELGVKQGVWKQWDRNGQIVSEVSIKDGFKDGVGKFYKDKELIKEQNYEDGLLHGKSTFYESDTTRVCKYDHGIYVEPKIERPEQDKERNLNPFKGIFNKKTDDEGGLREQGELKTDSIQNNELEGETDLQKEIQNDL